MQEQQAQVLPEINIDAEAPGMPVSQEPKEVVLLDIEKARSALNELGVWDKEDINPNDDFMDNEEYNRRIENIVTCVSFLRAVKIDNVNLVENIFVEQNQIDTKLVCLTITIKRDNFEINGVYDVTVLRNALLGISNNLPLGVNEDPYELKRKKAEKILMDENLIEKLKTIAAEGAKTPVAIQSELSDAFNRRANPKHKKHSNIKKFKDSFTRAIELLR